MRSDRGFIFTMDAVLALIPVFIILGSVSPLTDSQSLYTQSHILGTERVVQDVLESMRIHGDFDNIGPQDINNTLSAIMPGGYEYDYTIAHNGTEITNFNTSNAASDIDIIAGKRTAFINLEKVLDQVIAISHGGDPASTEYCSQATCGANQRVWQLEFPYAPNDYDYYLLFERQNVSTGGFWRIKEAQVSQSECTVGEKLCSINAGDGQQIYTGNELVVREKLTEGNVYKDETMTANKKYYVYVRVVANPAAFFDAYLIRTKLDSNPANITSSSIKIFENADVTLKVWRD